MKTNSYKIILGAALLLGTSALSAQTLNGAYFMERMPARHTLNPAFVAKSGYISPVSYTHLTLPTTERV